LRSTQSDGHGHRISLGDIERFQESYVSLAELARSEHRAPRALLCDIDVVPVTGPSIDGSRQYFFRRADLRAEKSPSGLTTGSRLPGGLPAQLPFGDDYD
jgi:hypothetical protein